MSVEYTNKYDENYYLKQSLLKSGKKKYNFTKTKPTKKEIVDKIPKGYEIAENVSGLVTLRKCLQVLIYDDELDYVKKYLSKKAIKRSSEVERKKREMIIYEAHSAFDAIAELLPFASKTPPINEKMTYEKVFKFILIDKDKRLFSFERWCYLGGIDDWIYLGFGSLKKVCDQTLKHIGKETFYELC